MCTTQVTFAVCMIDRVDYLLTHLDGNGAITSSAEKKRPEGIRRGRSRRTPRTTGFTISRERISGATPSCRSVRAYPCAGARFDPCPYPNTLCRTFVLGRASNVRTRRHAQSESDCLDVNALTCTSCDSKGSTETLGVNSGANKPLQVVLAYGIIRRRR